MAAFALSRMCALVAADRWVVFLGFASLVCATHLPPGKSQRLHLPPGLDMVGRWPRSVCCAGSRRRQRGGGAARRSSAPAGRRRGQSHLDFKSDNSFCSCMPDEMMQLLDEHCSCTNSRKKLVLAAYDFLYLRWILADSLFCMAQPIMGNMVLFKELRFFLAVSKFSSTGEHDSKEPRTRNKGAGDGISNNMKS